LRTLRYFQTCIYLNKKSPGWRGFFYWFRIVASSRNYANSPALSGAAYFKFHTAFGSCEQSVVTTHADIITGVKLGATLTNENIARQDLFTAKFFHTKAFGF
jgi:hypothetical protein